jgi:hypothetical protein
VVRFDDLIYERRINPRSLAKLNWHVSGAVTNIDGPRTFISTPIARGWGAATYYFAVGDDGIPTRQMEVYANGRVLKYDWQHVEDSFGRLADQALDADEFAPFRIYAVEFENAWVSHLPHNH